MHAAWFNEADVHLTPKCFTSNIQLTPMILLIPCPDDQENAPNIKLTMVRVEVEGVKMLFSSTARTPIRAMPSHLQYPYRASQVQRLTPRF
jgi:hypothetical protein